MKAFEGSDRTLVHQVWGELRDGTLVAMFSSFFDAEIFARGMVRERHPGSSSQASYVVSGGYDGRLERWDAQRLAEWDKKRAEA